VGGATNGQRQLSDLKRAIANKFEWTKTAGFGFEHGKVGARIASPQFGRDDAPIGKLQLDALFRANAFAGSYDQIFPPGDPARFDAAPAVHGYDAPGGDFGGCRQFIRKIHKFLCHDSSMRPAG
jgi:hypothetical protein